MKKKIFYWAPCLNKVGTVISSKNSAIALAKYKKEFYDVTMINVCGEWDKYENELKSQNVNLLNLSFSFHSYLPKTGFVKSRFSYVIIFLFCFIPLIKCLKRDKPDFIIIHLITSLPLVVLNLFKPKTKFILRISGMPKLNLLRYFFWKFSSKNLHKITCPTNELLKKISGLNIFDKQKIHYLQDAILNLDNKRKEFPKLQTNQNKIILAAGRLTKQKNFNYLIAEYNKFSKYYDGYDLIILGDGEEKKSIQKLIKSLGLNNKVYLKGVVDNVYEYMKVSDVLVLSSLWEEMGFVIVEAAYNNLFVITSNCPNGPKEFIEGDKCGLLFESNKKESLKNTLIKFLELKDNMQKKINAKKKTKNFTKFNHHKRLFEILNNENKI